ncbi:MAG TPA: hypothetical protein DHW07_01485 [Gammaproteobacteria bacterium]|nr:hypothetical protein [Gammaproteobacteria bacterium]|tara:strand:+ start:96 stop:419 length:324 start_codon:yes stop_codon:yes gene_type:complete
MPQSSDRSTDPATILGGGAYSLLADFIRRKKGSRNAKTQRSRDAPCFGITNESWVRLRWSWRWVKRGVRGWSMNAVVQWFGRRTRQDQNPKDKWSVGVANWWVTHQP